MVVFQRIRFGAQASNFNQRRRAVKCVMSPRALIPSDTRLSIRLSLVPPRMDTSYDLTVGSAPGYKEIVCYKGYVAFMIMGTGRLLHAISSERWITLAHVRYGAVTEFFWPIPLLAIRGTSLIGIEVKPNQIPIRECRKKTTAIGWSLAVLLKECHV
ncbi:hypothetical protein CBL_09550 [Carabus blaptoides fortunei]